MTNPIKIYLKSIHTASTSLADRQVALDDLNHALGTSLESPAMFERIHGSILAMFENYRIFGAKLQPVVPLIQARQWIAAAQHIESLIVNKAYPKDAPESPMRRGLIQVYLYYFASRYLNRPAYTYKYIQNKFLNLKNLNRLQSDRGLVFSELLVRMKAANKVKRQFHISSETIIPREKTIQVLCGRLEAHPYLMLIGPQGIGKTVTLNLLAEFMRGNWHVDTYQFTQRDQISHPDYFTAQMLAFFDGEVLPTDKTDASLYLLDDIHLLPPVLQQVLRIRVLPEVLKTEKKIAFIAASAYPLETLMTHLMDSPRFMPYHLPELDAQEVDALWHESPIKSSYSSEEIYKATRGYPALVGQMVASGVTFDHSQWFYAIFNAVNWDEQVTAMMKALCTFRYIGPFFMNDLAKFLKDPYRLQEVWHIPETILDAAKAHSLWEKLVHRNAFIHQVSFDQQDFPLDKNFIIARVLRQLAENAVRADQPVMYEQRHKLASEYYYSQISDPLIPGSKKTLLTIEYYYHLAKQGLSSKQIISISQSLIKLADTTEKPIDIDYYRINFLKYFTDDCELKEVMGEALFNEIIALAQREDIE
jgi:hypothetical protein